MHDLILADARTSLSELATTGVISVHTAIDREEVALLMNGYLALPVIDDDGCLVGIVTVDNVIDVIQEEVTDDIQRLVGVSGDGEGRLPVALQLRQAAAMAAGQSGDRVSYCLDDRRCVRGYDSAHHRAAVFIPIVAGHRTAPSMHRH